MISASDAFNPVRSALEQAGVRYAIGVSWASTAFGGPRFTNDVDIPADFTPETLDRFLGGLPPTVHVDREDAHMALRLGEVSEVKWRRHSGPRSRLRLNSRSWISGT